jgi:hypothetical protein
MLELKQEKEVQQTGTWELEDILDVSIMSRLGKITANMNANVSTIADNCEALPKTFARLSEVIAKTKCTQHAVNEKFDASFTHLADRLQKPDAQVAQTMDSIEKSLLQTIHEQLEELESNLKSKLTAVLETLDRVVSPAPLQQEKYISRTTLDSGNKATTHMDTGNGSGITAVATKHNTQASMQGLGDAHNSLANDHHGGEPLYQTDRKGFPSHIGRPV